MLEALIRRRATRRLIRAIRDGDLERVVAAIAAGADLASGPPLYLAACLGNGAIVNELLTRGAPPGTGVARQTPIEGASENGNLDVVKLLAGAGAEFGRSLKFAAIGGNIAVLDYLLSRGVDPMTVLSPPVSVSRLPVESRRRLAEVGLVFDDA